MDFHYSVNKALENYDHHQKFFRYIESLDQYFYPSVTKKSFLTLSDPLTKEVIFESEIQYLSVFYSKDFIWSWAWALSHFLKETSYLSRKLLNYGLDLTSDTDPFILRHIMVSSRLLITDMFHIDIIVALSSYILRCPYIMGKKEFVNGGKEEYIIVYYIIVEIDQMKKMEENFNEEQSRLKKGQII